MIETLNASQVAHKLLQDENAGWSYKGAHALAEYLEQYEEDIGESMELDVVAIRCDFSEYTTALEYALEHSWGNSIDQLDAEVMENPQLEKDALTFLQENTTVIEFDGGIIVQTF